MKLATNWSHIVHYPVADRDLLLFYNFDTGTTQSAALEPSGRLTSGPVRHFAAGWSHIVRCDRLLFFYNEVTGNTAAGTLDSDGDFEQLDLGGAAPGAGWRLVLGGQDQILCMATNGHWQRGSIGNVAVKSPSGYAYLSLELSPWRSGDSTFRSFPQAYAIGRDNVCCLYFADARVSSSLSIYALWLTDHLLAHVGAWEGGDLDTEFEILVANNAQLLGYAIYDGHAAVTRFPDFGFYSDPYRRQAARFTPLQLSSGWTDIVSVGWRLLFYASYSGDAMLGFLSPLDGSYTDLALS